MRKHESGFSAATWLLVVVVIAVLGGTSWYVWNKMDKGTKPNLTNDSQTTTPEFQSYTDTAKVYSLEYPENWTKLPYVWEPCCEGSPQTEPDWTKVPQPVELKPADAQHNDIRVRINADNTGARTIDKEWANRTIDQFNTYEKYHFADYEALYQTTDFVGPAEAEAYIDYRYLFVKGNNSVEVTFREKYRHDSNQASNFDARNYLADFNFIAESVKFLDQ